MAYRWLGCCKMLQCFQSGRRCRHTWLVSPSQWWARFRRPHSRTWWAKGKGMEWSFELQMVNYSNGSETKKLPLLMKGKYCLVRRRSYRSQCQDRDRSSPSPKRTMDHFHSNFYLITIKKISNLTCNLRWTPSLPWEILLHWQLWYRKVVDPEKSWEKSAYGNSIHWWCFIS